MGHLKNPYIIRGGPRVQKSAVAYIDILGFTDLVISSFKLGKNNDLLKKIYHALKNAREHIDPRYKDVFYKKRKKGLSVFTAFTDSIVIGYPTKFFGEEELILLCRELSSFQMSLTMEGFFVRGAIAIGDLYMDDVAVFGQALIEAIESEKKLAQFPRIVLAESARKAVDEYKEYYAVQTHAPLSSNIWEDADGQYYLNYLNTLMSHGEHLSKKELLEKHKCCIEDMLKKYYGDLKVWSKYRWVAKYHNDFCGICQEVDVNMRIDKEAFRFGQG